MQQQRKATVKDKLVDLSDRYLNIGEEEPLMDVVAFLEKWVPRFFSGICPYSCKKKEVYYSLGKETLEVTYKEACALLLKRWYPAITITTLTSWGAMDTMNLCPDTYKAGLYSIDVALELSLFVKKMVEQQQAAQQHREVEQQQAA